MAVFRCSCHQITWGDNLVEAIDDIGSFGYAGTETFGTVVTQFAGRAHDFQAMLQARGLRLSALYGGGPLHDPAQQAEAVANNLAIIDFLHEMGSDRLVVGPGKRTGTPTAQDLARFARGVSEVAAAARDKGIVAGMHPHWNTVIEQRDEITRFFDTVDTDSSSWRSTPPTSPRPATTRWKSPPATATSSPTCTSRTTCPNSMATGRT